jgi:hypothetical protein
MKSRLASSAILLVWFSLALATLGGGQKDGRIVTPREIGLI